MKPLQIYDVAGMTCHKCVRHVQRAFQRIDKANPPDVEVSLEENRARVQWPSDIPDFDIIHSALDKAGYQVSHTRESPLPQHQEAREVVEEDQKQTALPKDSNSVPFIFGLSGMTCASCVARVEKALSKVEGIDQASVNLATSTASVLLSPLGSPKAVFEAVEQAGYKAHELEDAAQGLTSETDNSPWINLLIAFTLALPIALSTYSSWSNPWRPWIEACLCTLILLGPGRIFFRLGFKALLRLTPDMNSLVALGLTASYGYSLGLISRTPQSTMLMFHEAGILVVFILFGRALEHRARKQAFGALSALLKEEPRTARRIVNGQPEEVATASLQPGDQVSVALGERVPVDGRLLDLSAAFDESLLTGESIPRQRAKGETIIAGSINVERPILMEVLREGKHSTLRRLVALVSRAQADKAPVQRFVDQVAAIFVPIVLLIALATGLSWLFVGGLAPAISHMVAVLVVACPCALGLATPTAIVVGSSRALEAGILIKSAPVLEALARIDHMIFDKTGTLTKGKPTLIATHGDEKDLPLALAMASKSRHPLSLALANAYPDIPSTPLSDPIQERPGLGLLGSHQGEKLAYGSTKFLDQLGMASSLDTGDEAQTLVSFGRGDRQSLIFAFSDPLRPEAKGVIAELQEQEHITCIMLTGDNERVAKSVAEQLSLKSFKSLQSPADKLVELEKLSQGPARIAMIGDGINDAPALARAHVGISLSSGTDVAQRAGDVVLMGSDLRNLLLARKLGKASLAKIRQNLVWASIYNLAGIPLAAGILAPWGIELPPTFAGLAMALSSVSVVINSLLLKKTKLH